MTIKMENPGTPLQGATGAIRKAAELPVKSTTRPRGGKDTRQARWADNHPLQVWAYRAYHTALRHGLIERKPCEVCGDENSELHHDQGYDKPLAGRFLCPHHHGQLHAAQRRARQ